ncbi:Hsp70-Hsp90 organizing protein [Gracilariopsis chorda]|uniref:Hsp70-Hsp90 organizing protein n=1 Tax=Gracilariopsis chorda TaxID=448386 RepID=A0A2V3IKR6_9FLOR|nr:Hsp70-Hsp90 organizing protein [Gracilariopsis chorda]|eukprot:PXF42671.1 Hsp70-Hsp90 organizing protein [Gracilariopsis chorda]
MASPLFNDDLWDKIRTDPETSALLEDPAFKQIITELRTDPSSLSKHIADPRVLKLFTVLSKSSTAQAQPSETVVEDVTATANDAPMPDKPPGPYEPDPSTLGPIERSLYEKDCGTAAYKKRDFPAAIDHYTKALEFDPGNMAFYTNRAAARLESGDIDGAIEDCKTAIKENSERHLRTDFKIIARAYGRMGNAYLKKEDYPQAIEAFEKSLVEYSDPKVTRSLREAQRVQRKKAEEAYIDPELSKKERQEGNQLFLAGKFPESVAKYTEAIKRNPKDAAPYSNRAAAYMKLGEFPMALKDCERCLENDPKFVKAYIRKGNIHFYMKEYHKCLEVYEKGLQLAPNNKELRQGLLKTNLRIQEQQSSGEVDQAQMEQAMKDPEIQKILQDPQMNTLLKQMQEDPKFAARAMRDPTISSKVQKLIASGILRVA